MIEDVPYHSTKLSGCLTLSCQAMAQVAGGEAFVNCDTLPLFVS